MVVVEVEVDDVVSGDAEEGGGGGGREGGWGVLRVRNWKEEQKKTINKEYTTIAHCSFCFDSPPIIKDFFNKHVSLENPWQNTRLQMRTNSFRFNFSNFKKPSYNNYKSTPTNLEPPRPALAVPLHDLRYPSPNVFPSTLSAQQPPERPVQPPQLPVLPPAEDGGALGAGTGAAQVQGGAWYKEWWKKSLKIVFYFFKLLSRYLFAKATHLFHQFFE